MFEELLESCGLAAKQTAARNSDEPIAPDFYDVDYFITHRKSNWDRPYTWENFQHIFRRWAAFLIDGFPIMRSFIDVGCGRGFLERGFLEIQRINKLYREGEPLFIVHGFDHSPFAIENCDPCAAPFIKRAGVDDYQFTQEYDVMLMFDVLGHLTQEQARDWLRRSRKSIRYFLFAVIELEEDRQRYDGSHVNLRSREWWHSTLLECGWRQDSFARRHQQYAMAENTIKFNDCQVFIYRS